MCTNVIYNGSLKIVKYKYVFFFSFILFFTNTITITLFFSSFSSAHLVKLKTVNIIRAYRVHALHNRYDGDAFSESLRKFLMRFRNRRRSERNAVERE